MGFDREALIENANAYDVAQAIGMNVVKRGTKYFIPCPGHETRLGKPDRKTTNAVLTPKGYRCYACDVNVGLIDMVMEFLGCDAKTAMENIAQTCGGAALYQTGVSHEDIKKAGISRSDIELIGLAGNCSGASSKRLLNASDSEPIFEEGTFHCKTDDGYYMYEKIEGWNLNRLYRENEWKFNNLIAYKARESMFRYQKAMKVFCDRDAEKAKVVYDIFEEDGCLESSVFIGLKNAFQQKYWRCKEIYEEYSSKLKKK
jgi:hypothetical protein